MKSSNIENLQVPLRPQSANNENVQVSLRSKSNHVKKKNNTVKQKKNNRKSRCSCRTVKKKFMFHFKEAVDTRQMKKTKNTMDHAVGPTSAWFDERLVTLLLTHLAADTYEGWAGWGRLCFVNRACAIVFRENMS